MATTVEILGFARGPDWLPWAVQYFFLIGISCAAFFISLPGLVWQRPEWRLLSRFALLAALISGLTAPVALLADLHQPGPLQHLGHHRGHLPQWSERRAGAGAVRGAVGGGG